MKNPTETIGNRLAQSKGLRVFLRQAVFSRGDAEGDNGSVG
jgi:hypothetical protein